MKERPIIFSGEMVRAILAGRKTQTRRVITPQPVTNGTSTDLTKPILHPRYGHPGDRLWVRETWREMIESDLGHNFIWYRADGEQCRYPYAPDLSDKSWRPSIFMPRWASRITLEVVSIRVERVQDISEADAKAEGATFRFGENGEMNAFNNLWDSINAKRGYGWNSNPWVWCVEFIRPDVPRPSLRRALT